MALLQTKRGFYDVALVKFDQKQINKIQIEL
jgi:hypothetical protein